MELIKKQVENSEQLRQAIKNFKKSPLERKTLNYLRQYSQRLTEFWTQVNRTDRAIRNDPSIPDSHEYYTSKQYEEISKMYNEVIAKIEHEIKELQAEIPLQNSNDIGASTSQSAADNVIQPKLPEKIQITAVKELLQKADEDHRSAQFLTMQLRTIEQHWAIVNKIHEQSWTAAGDDYDINEYLHQEAKVNEEIFNLAQRIRLLEHTTTANSTVNVHGEFRGNEVKLPTIELPNFDGSYMKWRQFNDLFTEMVHNQPLSNIQKLCYLKSRVSGEASSLIKHLPTTSESYAAAWQIINNRYNNKRLLVGTTLQQLLTQQPVQRDSAASIKQLHDSSLECLLGLQAMGLNTDSWDPILVHILSQLLDRQTQLLWEQSLKDPRDLPNLHDFMKFLELRFQSMEAVGPAKRANHQATSSLVTTTNTCIACNQSHQLFQCQDFKKMATKRRLQLVQAAKSCVNCLKTGHNKKNCPSTSNCQRCNKRHNTLLHLEQLSARKDVATTNTPITNNSQSIVAPSASSLVTASTKEKSSVLLSTAIILVDDIQGQQVECRAILDNGSQVHLVTQEFAKKLGLRELSHKLRIQGIGETHQQASKGLHIQLRSRVTSFTSSIEALIVPKIVAQQPRQFINTRTWKIPNNIKLGDPCFNVPSNVDMLIGAEIFFSILSVGQINLGKSMPTLQNSLFGWLVAGEHPITEIGDDEVVCGISITDEELCSTMERFWEMEECPTPSRQMTTTELACENYFKNTHQRTDDGRFMVKLPFVKEQGTLGESYGLALKRLNSLEKRLTKDELLQKEYIKFLREYEQLGHMTEICKSTIKGPHYFLPHHPVLKPESTSTRVRVVFDASAETSTKMSLNNVLSIGPSIQDDVFSQILRFRLPKYVFTADIEKMYRQIWVHDDDRRFQLILWRENPSQQVKIFQLNTVTYGTSCAPYLAIRCLRQLGDEGSSKYPLASEIINKNFYVDDVVAGSDNINIAMDQVNQLRELLNTAGLKLRKWCSNDHRLLRHIPENDRAVSLQLNKSESIKTMGLIWTPKEDCFSIRAEIKFSSRVTKRNALAEISRIFDPLGFIAPVTVTAKIILQELWRLKLDWDAALPQDLHTKWILFRNEFCQLSQLKIARHTFGKEEPRSMEIHIFADASEKAYGAVAYARTISKTKTVIIRILCAKSKVAPTKQTTLPRLELCAAKLAASLMKRIQMDLDIDKKCFHLWSDSTAVLGWINAQSSNYHTFVANRIAEIQRISNSSQWHYIQSKENPADMISRGLYPSQLVNNHFWFYGPKVIHGNSDSWNKEELKDSCSLELKQKAKISLPIFPADGNMLEHIRHNNSFRKLQRIVAYMLRICKPKPESPERSSTIIHPLESQHAMRCIVKYVQNSEFRHNIQTIQKYGCVEQNTSIAHLSPFLDEYGILRVGGRLEAANIGYDAKHPMLLSHKHPITKLILKEIHTDNMHAGAQTILAISRQKFWVINGKTLARNIIHNCVRCVRYRPKLAEQVMGNLPKDRVTAARPFFISGVDFCGPVFVHYKSRGRRPSKAYVAVFCCFSTKAVHLELVSDLTTEAFIGAVKRFTGRRGRCQKIYCDNATNFKGTRNALAEISKIIHEEEATSKIRTECGKRSIEFCFIPPRAPHFGGLWEAAVKSAKNLLHSTLSAASLTYEEMETVLIDAEAILNSRPLTPLSSDPNDMTALTPGHFLIGEPLTTVADPQADVKGISGLTRWNLVRHLKNEFWRRWSVEYLNGLQSRYRWNKESSNMKVGTMVIIKEENLPPCKWPLGRIEQVIRGEDGYVRVVDVRTSNNVTRRPIHKLAPLPIEQELLELPQEIEPRTSPVTRKRKATSCIKTLLLTCLVLQATSASVTFTPFSNEPGVYFERIGMTNIISNTWNLVNYVDMRPFLKEADLARKYLLALTGICNALKPALMCQGIVQHIAHQTQMIDSRNSLLIYKHRRTRGAINVVGNIAGALFGLLDSEYAKELSMTIDELRATDESIKHYVQNQTTFLDRTLTIVKKGQEEIEMESTRLNNLIQKNQGAIAVLTSEIQKKELKTHFNTLSLQAFMQVVRFQTVQDALIDIITDAHHGKINPELLTPQEFQEQLREVHTRSTKNARLPLPVHDVTQYIRIMTISHRITDNYIIFNIKIPLVAAKQFELLKLTPIPWARNNTLFRLHLTNPYLLVDLLRENHMPMSSDELQRCITIDQLMYFCPMLQPTHNTNSTDSNCVLSILRTGRVHSDCHPIPCEGGPYWRSLQVPNNWLVAVGSNELANAVCDNTPSQIELSGVGILRVGNGCTVRTSTMTIEGHGDIFSKRQIVYAPGCNVSRIEIRPTLTAPNSSRSSYKVNADIDALQEELHNFKTTSADRLRPHDIHHYGLGYTILLLTSCCIICLAWLWNKHKQSAQTIQPIPTPRRRSLPQLGENDDESHITTIFER